MTMIKELTTQQERDLIAFRERMWRQGVSCEPADKPRAERAIAAAYAEIGRPAPHIIWMPSPMTCALALHVLGEASKTPAGLWDGLWDGLRAGLQDGLRAGLRDGLWDGLQDGLRAGLRDGLWDGLRAGLRAGLQDGLWAGLQAGLRAGLQDGLQDGLQAGLWDGLWDGLQASLQDGLWDGLQDGLRAGQIAPSIGMTWWWGQMDTYWLSFYRFGTDLGVTQKPELMRRLAIMEEIAASCGFWYPRDGVCIVSDRFASVRWDEARNAVGLPFRLHCDDGPAVSFRDSWAIYCWHGMRLPPSHEWIITDPSRITAESVQAEPNAELRRVMLERTGFRPILDRAIVRAEDTDGNGHRRRLMEAIIGGEPIRMVEVVNGSVESDGSRKTYILGAMPGATPHEAIAASYGINPAHYREAVRT